MRSGGAGRPTSPSKRDKASRIAGNWQARSRSMPTYCDPLPGKEHRQPCPRRVRRPDRPPRATPAMPDFVERRGEERIGRHRSTSPGNVPVDHRQESTRDGGIKCVHATVLPRRRGRLSSRRLLAKPPGPTSRPPACAAAERATICTSPSQAMPGAAGSASSNTQWKLLPPNPKALTAARRGWSALASQGRGSTLT